MRVAVIVMPRLWSLWLTSVLTSWTAVCHGQLVERVIHSFNATNGEEPYAGLVQCSDRALYGTTFLGGSNNAGVMFKVRPDGSDNGPLWSFPRNPVSPGGQANPSGLIQGTDGALYGTDGFGGTNGVGSVFRMKPDGTGFTVLHSFSRLNGEPYEPSAALSQGADGMLYGTTQFGGVGTVGAVFKVTTNGSDFAILHQFGAISNDGNQPQAPVIQGMDGALYGTTTLGGTSAIGGASGFGTIYRLTTNGSALAILHDFRGPDGQYPFTAGVVQDRNGILYGTTQQGGNSGFGTVFRMNPDGTGFSNLHSFASGPMDGAYPNSAMVFGNDEVLYGVTEMGGANNYGTIFRLNIQGGGFRILYHFGGSTNDGRYPGAPLIQAHDGGLFGTTKFGGDYNRGTVFRLAPGPPLISLQALPDRTMRISVSAASNFTYRIDASTDHLHWGTLTNLLNQTGTVEFIDSSASNSSLRFYRAAWVP